MAIGGQWSEASRPITEDEKAKAKKLLKADKMAKGEDDHARGMRAYLRAIASGRDADYLLNQKGDVGKGAKHARKLLGENYVETPEQEQAPFNPLGYRGRLFTGVTEASVALAQQVKLSNTLLDFKGMNHGRVDEAKKIIAQTWEFKKKGSAAKFYRLLLNLARRDKATWHPEKNSTGLRIRVSGESYGSGQITPIDQSTFNKLDTLAAVHNGRRGQTINESLTEASAYTRLANLAKDRYRFPWINSKQVGDNAEVSFKKKSDAQALIAAFGAGTTKKDKGRFWAVIPGAGVMNEDCTASELDTWWSDSRPKLIKGSKATRLSRMNGCIKSLRALRDGGVQGDGMSKPELNPVPKKERDSEDQPKDATPGMVDEANTEETMMNLNDAVARFRSLDEANINAPVVSRTNAGGKQFSPKTKFSHYAGPGETYTGDSAPVPADKEPQSADVYYGAASGQDSSGREYIDVRVESMDPDKLVGMLEQIAQASGSLEEFARLIDKHLGFDAVIANLGECENIDNAETFVGRIFEHAASAPSNGAAVRETEAQLRAKGMGLDDFDIHGDTWDEDQAFADDMMGLGEANLTAPQTGRSNAGGKQIDPKSRFRQPYKGADETYDGDEAGVPADKEAMAAMSHSAGVTGPGYGPDGREEIDVRSEAREPVGADELEAFAQSMTYPTKDMKAL